MRRFTAGGATPGQIKVVLDEIVLFSFADGETFAARYTVSGDIHLTLRFEAVLADFELQFLEDKLPVVGVEHGLATP